MSAWLLDTNVVSELRKPRPNGKVLEFLRLQQLDNLYLSEVSFAEIRFGIEKNPDPGRRHELTAWLSNRLRPMFHQRVLTITEDVLFVWRLLLQAGRQKGHTFSHPDVLIAATAAHYGLTVVTRNTKEFIAAELPVYNPWQS